MGTPTRSIVSQELQAARAHCRVMLDDLSQAELLWVPQRRDGVSVLYHGGHIVLVEDTHVAEATEKPVLASPEFQDAFGVHNVNNREARLPVCAEVFNYMEAVRARTLELLALRFQGIRDADDTIATAELFRGLINHEYSHTKYIRRIRSEMGKPPVDPPLSALVRSDEHAIAPPQYQIHHWCT